MPEFDRRSTTPEEITLDCPDCDYTVTAPDSGAGSAKFKLAGHRFRQHGVRSANAKAPVEKSSTETPAADDSGTAGEVYAERTPTMPGKTGDGGKGLLGRFWGAKEKEPTNGTAPKTTERKPSAPKRRVSAASFWGDMVGPVSAVAARAGYVPMARAMQWSSPVAGEIIEDATKGTVVDRLIQPVVRNSEKWQDLGDLLGFWAAIGVAQRNPAQSGAALAFARGRLVNLLPRIAANIKKERARERDAVEALTELMPDLKELFPDMGPDDDPVELLIRSLFAAPAGAEPVPV